MGVNFTVNHTTGMVKNKKLTEPKREREQKCYDDKWNRGQAPPFCSFLLINSHFNGSQKNYKAQKHTMFPVLPQMDFSCYHFFSSESAEGKVT